MRRISNDDSLYFLTITVVDWIDVFSRHDYKQWLADQIIYCQKKKGLELYSYVIMTNHLHFVARMNEGLSMSNFLRDFKSYTGKKLIDMISNNPVESRKEWMLSHFASHGQKNPLNDEWQFWQNGSHPTSLYSTEVIQQKVNYVHENPVGAGFVADAHEYFYSSACPHSPIKVIES